MFHGCAVKDLGLKDFWDWFIGTKPAALAIRKTSFGVDVLSSHPLMAAIEEALELVMR